MGKSKKVKLSSSISSKSGMMSGNVLDTHQPEMVSSKKKKKSKKGDTSLQSTLSSYVSTSSSPTLKLQPKSNPTDGLKTKVSPKKEHTQAPSNEYNYVESLDHNKKRKSLGATEDGTSKKIKLGNKNDDLVSNTLSSMGYQNETHAKDMASSSPGISNPSGSAKRKSILSPKSSPKKRGHSSNISSDEGVDSGEELTSPSKNHLGGHLIEEEEIEENQLEEQQPQSEMDKESDWTKEQTEELIFMIEEKILVVKPEDSMSYRCRMKALPWGNLPDLLHPPRTKQECKDRLHTIMEETKSVRNLYEKLRAYKVKPHQKRATVMIPFRRFILDHREELKKLKGNWIVNARAAFDALTEEEMRLYTDPYNDEMAQRKTRKSKPGRSTFKIFCETLPNVSTEEQKEKFLALTANQKVSFIKQALKEHKQSLKDFKVQHGDNALSKSKPPASKLTKEEWRLYLESKGMPLLRAVTPYQLFLLDRGDIDPETGANASKNALRRYHDFVRSQQHADYELKFKQELNEFATNFKAWFGKLKDELCKEPAHAYYTEMTTNKGGVKKNNLRVKVTSKVQELEQSYVESTMIGKFNDEPAPAPMTAKEVFKHFAKAKNPKATMNELNNTWNHLPTTHKAKFTEVAINNIKEYKAKLKHYVKGLSDHERRVYIGQNRVRYIRVFEGTDIFEKNFPCSEYPPFRIPGKNEKKSPTKKTKRSALDIDLGLMFTTSSPTNGVDEGSGSEEKAMPNEKRTISEESFKGRLPSSSTPGTIDKKRTNAAKQTIASKKNDHVESDSGSSTSESDDDVDGSGNGSTRYLDAVQKVHPKKLLEAYSESESDESSESEEESPKPTLSVKASRSPATLQATPKQPVACATGGDASSSEEETSSSSSDENARVATMPKSLSNTSKQTVESSPLVGKASPHAVRAPPHHTLSTKTYPQHLSPMKQMASSNKTATPFSKLLPQTPNVAAQRQAESSSSESSDSEEESPPPKKNTVVKSALGRMKPTLPPPKDDSSSEEDDDMIESAWNN